MENKLRLCEVNGRIGYFHCWEHYSDVVGDSPFIGGPKAGQISSCFGLVEFNDEVIQRVNPTSIKFCDEINYELHGFNNTKPNKSYSDMDKDSKRYTDVSNGIGFKWGNKIKKEK